MRDFVYLDYAATTPLNPVVAERMRAVQQAFFANPSSNHIAGRRSAAVIAQAEEQLGSLLSADPGSFLWTSGATESNNLAILGAARHRQHRGRHLVTMPHIERSIFSWNWAHYPSDRTSEVSPWIKAFENAREWLEANDQR